MNKVGEDEQFDPREIFSKLFGGEAFYDYVSSFNANEGYATDRAKIGEIALVKGECLMQPSLHKRDSDGDQTSHQRWTLS